jgi:hypothetical protein
MQGCDSKGAQRQPVDLERQAARFMVGYAQDLRAHNREALIERYDPRGIYFLGNGSKTFLPTDSLAAFYRTRWNGPAFFDWSDLSYEVIAPSAVLVIGKFVWKDPTRPDTLVFSYTNLLLLHAGKLHIRLEDESPRPRNVAKSPR